MSDGQLTLLRNVSKPDNLGRAACLLRHLYLEYLLDLPTYLILTAIHLFCLPDLYCFTLLSLFIEGGVLPLPTLLLFCQECFVETLLIFYLFYLDLLAAHLTFRITLWGDPIFWLFLIGHLTFNVVWEE